MTRILPKKGKQKYLVLRFNSKYMGRINDVSVKSQIKPWSLVNLM